MRLPKEGTTNRLRGFGYAELSTVQDLEEALALTGEVCGCGHKGQVHCHIFWFLLPPPPLPPPLPPPPLPQSLKNRTLKIDLAGDKNQGMRKGVWSVAWGMQADSGVHWTAK